MSQIPELMGGRRLSHSAVFEGGVLNATGDGVNVQTLAAAETLTLTKDSAPYQKITADAANNCILVLPPEETSKGLAFMVHNTPGGTLEVQDDAAATVNTLAVSELETFVCDGASWVRMGSIAIT